jgi:serine/threonine-protein kinase
VSLLTGQVLGRCYLEQLLGEGTFAHVYKAQHQTLGVPVAVKVLREHFPGLSSGQAAIYRERFRREAQMAARLSLDGIVRVHDFGEEQGLLYLVMEYVDGTSLHHYLRTAGSLSEPMALSVIGHLASVLQKAHAQNIVHRDLKPANVLVTRDGWLKISDLGLAKDVTQLDMTHADTVVGTPQYMAPECFQEGKAVGTAADIYSLGVMLFEMLLGRPPFGGSLSHVIHGHLHVEPQWWLEENGRRLTLAPPMVQLLRALLAKDPDARPKSCAQVAALCKQRLDQLRGTQPAAARQGAVRRVASSSASSSAIRRLGGLLERNLGSQTSEYQGRTILHSTMLERVAVWSLLILLLSGCVAAFVLLR